MQLKTVLLAGAAAVGISGAGQAAEPVSWTGFYAGAHVGYIWGEVDEPAIFPGEIDPEGFFLGAQVGYDYQLANNIVLGAFVASPFLFADEDEDAFGGTFEAELEWAVIMGGRAGYAFDNVLPYILLGYVIGDGNGKAEFPGGGDYDITETHDGYIVGLGADVMVAPNVTVGVQGAYTDMSSERYEFATPSNVSFESLTLAITANYRF